MGSSERVEYDRPEADVLDAVVAEVRARGDEWFAGLGVHPAVCVVERRTRPRCSLIRLRLDGSVSRHVMVKVRRAEQHPVASAAARPRLQPGAPDGAEDGWLEYAGLLLIADAVPAEDDRFGVVRPLAWLADVNALIMDDVRHPTLRDVLLRTSRLRPGGWTARTDDTPWRNAGAWLRHFHVAPTDLPLQERNGSSEDAVVLCDRFRAYIASVGRHAIAAKELAEVTIAALRTLPEDLPLGTGHGDFAARNLFAAPNGRITAFDPLPRWRVPVHEDLARFVVGIRLLGLQAMTQGLAFPRARLAAHENAFLEGYFSPAQVPQAAVRAYTGLILLDKWCALLSQGDPAKRSTRKSATVRLCEPYYASEALRVASELRSVVSSGSSGPRTHP